MVRRFDVWEVRLDPTAGSEIGQTRPCVIVSPEEVNHYLNTVIVVPLTSTIKPYPTRLNCEFKGKKGQLVIDQIRSIDKIRLLNNLGRLDDSTAKDLSMLLEETFRY